MLLDTLKDKVQGTKRVPVEIRSLEIEFSNSSYKRLGAHYRAYERTWMANSLTPTFTSDEFLKYIESIFALRCKTISESPKEFAKTIKRVKIPALIYLVLENLGLVEAKDFGLVISPVWNGKIPMTRDEVENVSLKLQELEDLGHEMARGLPQSLDGSVDFMMMQVIDELVMTSVPSTHPVYALLRSFVKMASFQDLVIPRIHFLDQGEYDFQYDNLVRSGR